MDLSIAAKESRLKVSSSMNNMFLQLQELRFMMDCLSENACVLMMHPKLVSFTSLCTDGWSLLTRMASLRCSGFARGFKLKLEAGSSLSFYEVCG